MNTYKTFTTITDQGPYILKISLDMPNEVGVNDVCPDTFNVYVERKGPDGNIIVTKIFVPGGGPVPTFVDGPLCKGYRAVKKAYPCNNDGEPVERSNKVALEFDEEPLGKCVEGTVLFSGYITSEYRITLLKELPGNVTGLVFDTCTDNVCYQMVGWAWEGGDGTKDKLGSAWFTPTFAPKDTPAYPGIVYEGTKVPLFVWLHGAGEGGTDPRLAFTGNKVVAFSTPEVQKKLGGAAYILTPQSPTVWMDDGKEQLGRSNISIYEPALKKLIDDFVASHADTIDTNRIYIGGLSNGGFMTMRMILDYPDYFAAAIPVCEVFYSENISDTMLDGIKNVPIWFVHCKLDELVPPNETSVPTYHRLKDAGNTNVHYTYFDYNRDLTGQYRDELGRPQRMFNHGVWVHVYNDDCTTDLDGSHVMEKGIPVTLLEWLGMQGK